MLSPSFLSTLQAVRLYVCDKVTKMTAIPPTDRWIEFFTVYRRLPALWKISDDIYKNKRLKAAGYKKLLASYIKIDPHANVDSMRRRLNGIRTCYRRELRKVEQSESTTKNPEDVYVPHLWYFKELSFLRCDIGAKEARDASLAIHEETTDSFFNDEDADLEDEPMEEVKSQDSNFTVEEPKIEQHLEDGQPTSPNTACLDHSQLSTMEMSLNHTQMLPPLTLNPNQRPSLSQSMNTRDEASIFAEGWAISYRKLDERNRLLAKKAIEEIMVLGQLNQLEFNSVRMPH